MAIEHKTFIERNILYRIYIRTVKNFLRFPEFDTYVRPVASEEHNDDVLTEQEIKALEKKEMKFQEKQKKRKKKQKEQEKRKCAKKRTQNI